MTSLFEAARQCLDAADPADKVALTHRHAAAFLRGELAIPADAPPPQPIGMPGRPPRPRLVHPRELPRRGLGSDEGRAAFLHAIAHIELNAIDLGWDAVYRFRGLPADFYRDWVQVADDEARHFVLLRDRLRTVEILETIQREEVAHVAAGSRWYRWHCQRAGVEPRARFRELLVEYASGYLRGPFNIQARLLAGFDEDELASLQALAP